MLRRPKSKGTQRISWLMVLSLILSLLLSACSRQSSGQLPEERVEQVITYNNSTPPARLDPAKAQAQPDLQVINTVFEGLVRYGKDNTLQEGMASQWEISEDMKTYTFILRDCQWSNGDPVSTEDFLFAWERVLNPKTASPYAYLMYSIVNAQEYNEGKIKSFSEVGVKAIDAKTLEVQLKAPAPEFLGLTAFGAFMPVNKKSVSVDESWATQVDSYIGNGPFKMSRWENNPKFEFIKNENYWDKESVQLETLVYTYVPVAMTEYNMFLNDQIDFGDNPPLKDVDRLIQENVVAVAPALSTYYYQFNVKVKPFDDPRVRKALSLAIDREYIVKNITQAGQIPAYAFVPYGFPDAESGQDFRKTGGDFFKEDLNDAKQLLTEAGYPEGSDFPPVELLVNDSEGHKQIALALVEMWKENLGITLSVKSMEWNAWVQARNTSEFQIIRSHREAGYLDGITFVDFASWGNPEFNQIIQETKIERDSIKRYELLHKAEKLMMEDMVVLPIYFNTNLYYAKPYLKGYIVPSFGPFVEFKWASVEKH